MSRSLTCLLVILPLAILPVCGCMQSLEEQTKKSDKSIIGKKTQDIGNFDPKADNKVSDSKVEITNPITGGLEAYGPMLEQISKTHIQQAVDLYHAENGGYPKDYNEFMEKVIKPNNIKLPVLPGTKKYQYDVENHKLVVVDVAPAEEEKK